MLQARSPSRMLEDSLQRRFCHFSACSAKSYQRSTPIRCTRSWKRGSGRSMSEKVEFKLAKCLKKRGSAFTTFYNHLRWLDNLPEDGSVVYILVSARKIWRGSECPRSGDSGNARECS